MNAEQRAIVASAMAKGHRAIEALRREGATRDVAREIESYEGEIAMLQDDDFMTGLFASWEEVKRGEKGTPGRDLKRKYKSA